MTESIVRNVAEFLAIHPDASIVEIRVALALPAITVHAALLVLDRDDIAA